jgi:hypothetical protein
MFWMVRTVAGNRLVRIPADQIDDIGSVVRLKCTAEKLRLHEVEDKARAWIPRVGAM